MIDGMSVSDYYGLLGVSPTASEKEIRHAFREKARFCHPDKCAAPDAAERFRLVRKAFEILSDSASRSSYDVKFAATIRQSRGPTGNVSKHGSMPTALLSLSEFLLVVESPGRTFTTHDLRQMCIARSIVWPTHCKESEMRTAIAKATRDELEQRVKCRSWTRLPKSDLVWWLQTHDPSLRYALECDSVAKTQLVSLACSVLDKRVQGSNTSAKAAVTTTPKAEPSSKGQKRSPAEAFHTNSSVSSGFHQPKHPQQTTLKHKGPKAKQVPQRGMRRVNTDSVKHVAVVPSVDSEMHGSGEGMVPWLLRMRRHGKKGALPSETIDPVKRNVFFDCASSARPPVVVQSNDFEGSADKLGKTHCLKAQKQRSSSSSSRSSSSSCGTSTSSSSSSTKSSFGVRLGKQALNITELSTVCPRRSNRLIRRGPNVEVRNRVEELRQILEIHRKEDAGVNAGLVMPILSELQQLDAENKLDERLVRITRICHELNRAWWRREAHGSVAYKANMLVVKWGNIAAKPC